MILMAESPDGKLHFVQAASDESGYEHQLRKKQTRYA
jgi:hypothetical protein